MLTVAATRFKVLGINQDASFCECCGKQGLNSVVWIEDTETGSIKHFGQICAVKPAKGFDCVKEIKAAIGNIKQAEKDAASLASKMYRVQGGALKEVEPFTYAPANAELYAKCKQEAKAKIWAARNL